MLEIAVIKIGPQGLSGPQGAQGIEGPQGTQGLPGPDGSAFTVDGAALTITDAHRNGVIRVTTVGACVLTFSAAISAAFKVSVINAGSATITIGAEAPLSVSGILSFTSGGVECWRGNGENVIYTAAAGEENDAFNLGTEADGPGVFGGKFGARLGFKRFTSDTFRFFVSDTTIRIEDAGMLFPAAQAFIDEYGITDPTAKAEIDDLLMMFDGLSCENSTRGTIWTQLPASILGSMVTGASFRARHCPGGVLSCLKTAWPMTAAGGVVIGTDGTVFDGVDDRFAAAGPILTTGKWSFIGGWKNPTAGGNNETFASQFGVTVNRLAAAQLNPAGQFEAFWGPPSGNKQPNSGVAEASASARLFMSRQTDTALEVFRNSGLTPAGSVACVPGAFEAVPWRYGSLATSGWFSGTGLDGFLFDTDIDPACWAPLPTNLNAILGATYLT